MADEEKDDQPLNAVVITREFTGDGNFSLTIGETGDVLKTETGDILRYALALHDRKFRVQ